MKFNKYAVLAAALVSTAAMADSGTITFAADSSSGTYNKMLGEIINVCPDINVQVAKDVHGGAPGNLEALVNNKVNAAFMHSDVFLANSMSDPTYAKFKTLVALYPEPIHIIALRDSKTGVSGWKGMLGSKADFNSLGDLAGYKVGAAGGGVYTARILTGQGQGNFEVVEYASGDALVAGLNKGEVAAAIFVGAAPLPILDKVDKSKFKLIPVGENIAGRVSTVYRPVKISGYVGLQTTPVSTLAPLAVIMTRTYNTDEKKQMQAQFRACFNQHLGNLKDDASPNWQAVEDNDHGTLNNWLDLPVATGAKRK